ncbi:hypothetical protein N0Y54_40770 [Nostoc punctiforme UO1]|uniref:hypothetical protein n=1 Tax=Nostoc punctiforme TaxID=272131 RepID=UPI0030A2AFEF
MSAIQISENESLNKAAERLLKGILGQSKAGQTSSSSDDIKEIVRQEISALTASTPSDEGIKQVIRQELTDALAQIKGLIDERNGGVINSTQEAVLVVQQSQPDYSAIRSSILDKLKTGKQSAAKAIDAFIQELSIVSSPEQPAHEELDVALK